MSVWNEVLCAPPPVISIFKTFLFDPGSKPAGSAQRKMGLGVRAPGAKVDVVADNGRRWIRINTIKNSRLISEFREIDSYFTESDSDSEGGDGEENGIGPSLAQTEFDNSILKMGRALMEAARTNRVERSWARRIGSGKDEGDREDSEIPKVVMRLTRLEVPPEGSTGEYDERIRKTVRLLEEMGVTVELGERLEEELPVLSVSTADEEKEKNTLAENTVLHPSLKINLDLSVLIALISDLTHAELPKTMEEAKKRFIPPKQYREWKEMRRKKEGRAPLKPWKRQGSEGAKDGDEEQVDLEDLPNDLATHSRALRNQLLQEMGKSMITEIRERLMSIPGHSSDHGPVTNGVHASTSDLPPVEFWATKEARDRCLRIVSKIGGVDEKRRAYALFCLDVNTVAYPPVLGEGERRISVEEGEELFWQGSRFEKGALPLFPMRFHEGKGGVGSGGRLVGVPDGSPERPRFFKELAKTCRDILEQEIIPHPRSVRDQFISRPQGTSDASNSNNENVKGPELEEEEIQRATVTKVNPRLTAHTVESLLWGAELGWTTLTANRTSVKAMLKEMRRERWDGGFGGLEGGASEEGGDGGGKESVPADGRTVAGNGEVAAIWIVDPRSLAEQMSTGVMTTKVSGG
ncbi:hypothetical protein CC2G_015028 [Coprinopsis cinerea AmutBmut pab1-1]|nr:hypothetical protein CC2G_015028 [Coprinopsis cinerea AmutBmut pab1-1]